MNNPIFKTTLQNACLPSLKPAYLVENSSVRNHWQEEKNLEKKNVFVAQKYNDPKIVFCLSTIRSILGEYTFSETSMIKEIIEADYNVEEAIKYLLGERIIQRNRGTKRMPVEKTTNGQIFIRNDLKDLPDEEVLRRIHENSLYRISNIIHPLNDCAAHVQDYVQNNLQFYQSAGFGVRTKKVKDKTKDTENKKKTVD